MQEIIGILEFIKANIVTIIGFVITIYELRRNYRLRVKESIRNAKEETYVETIEIADKITVKKNIVFDAEFIEQINHIKYKIKMYANKKVEHAYRRYWEYVVSKYESYTEYCKLHEPSNNPVPYEEEEDKYRDLQEYDYMVEKFLKDNEPKFDEYNAILDELIEAMRADIENKKR